MHPEVVQDGPGTCPICGMALEPRTATLAAEQDPELRAMSRRLWIGLALTLPLVVLNMAHLLSGSPRGGGAISSNWVELVLATPVVLGCGWPFFVRAWRSVLTRHLNMFTLIGMGTGIA